MHRATDSPLVSKQMLWSGRILTILAVLFLVMDGVMKLFDPPFVVSAMARLGYPNSESPGIGILLLACTLVYIVPQTSVIGAVLLSGYLGGAVASNIRIGEPLLSNVLFPVYFAVIMWTGLFLTDTRLWMFLPHRSRQTSTLSSSQTAADHA